MKWSQLREHISKHSNCGVSPSCTKRISHCPASTGEITNVGRVPIQSVRNGQSVTDHRKLPRRTASSTLEAGDHNPSIDTLSRLSRGLGINFNIVVRPETVSFDLTA